MSEEIVIDLIAIPTPKLSKALGGLVRYKFKTFENDRSIEWDKEYLFEDYGWLCKYPREPVPVVGLGDQT